MMLTNYVKLIDSEEGDYFYREEIKKLRANIVFTGRKYKKIMFTSCFQGEGKSDTVFHLAVDMTKLGKRVLLIDADIRNSQYVSRYGVTQHVLGLSEYLSGQVDEVNQIFYQTNYDNLFLIFSGAYASNPSEMLADESFGRLLAASGESFDYVFIDTPPLGQIIDAAQI
jgi:capsular exopolysaccharide synthesis family protein